jgi:hypothetical protein
MTYTGFLPEGRMGKIPSPSSKIIWGWIHPQHFEEKNSIVQKHSKVYYFSSKPTSLQHLHNDP